MRTTFNVTMTYAQKRSLVTLQALIDATGFSFHTRHDIGRISRGSSQGMPQKTLLRLWELGLVEPESEDTVRLVRERVCRCGCDRWTITDSGREQVGAMRVHMTDAVRELLLLKFSRLRKEGRTAEAKEAYAEYMRVRKLDERHKSG